MNLGDRVRDRVTGFTGIALARIDSLYEATQWRVQPESLKPDDGSITGFIWLEEGRLEVLSAGHEASKFTGFKVVKRGEGMTQPEMHFKQEASAPFDLLAAQAEVARQTALLSHDIDDAPELRQVHRQLAPDRDALDARRIFDAITPCARQVAKLLVSGGCERDQDIAIAMGISINGVHRRMRELFDAAGVDSRVALVLHIVRWPALEALLAAVAVTPAQHRGRSKE